jgi:hypothetical protein
MMFKPHKAISFLAIAGLAFASTAANAATTAYSADDLILGFQQTGTSGASQSLLVDLGQASGFKSGASAGTVIAGLGSVLSSTFGSGWASDSTISYGIVGSPGSFSVGTDVAKTLYASSPETTYGTQSVPGDPTFTRLSSSTQGTGTSNIATMGSTFNGLTASIVGSSGNIAAALQANSTSGGWAFQNPSGFAGANFSYFYGLEGTLASGVGSSALDLFRMQPGSGGTLNNPGTYVGSFTLNSSGDVSFGTSAPSAVPEPARAAFLGLGLGGLLLRRRRSARTAAAL